MADKRGTRECRGSKSVGQLYMRGVPVYDSATWSKEGRHSLRLTFWIANFVVVQITGYKASLFSTAHSDEGWLVTVHYQIAWVLFAIYVLISFLCSWMLWKMLQANTGLKWDPVRIVDILALFHGSNVLEDFEDWSPYQIRTRSNFLGTKPIGWVTGKKALKRKYGMESEDKILVQVSNTQCLN